MISEEEETEERKRLYPSTFKACFLLLWEQRFLHFHFALGPTNDVARSPPPR